jgi:hypothetical protein
MAGLCGVFSIDKSNVWHQVANVSDSSLALKKD